MHESAKGDRLENEDEVNQRQRGAEDDAVAQVSGREVCDEQREREQVRDAVRCGRRLEKSANEKAERERTQRVHEASH